MSLPDHAARRRALLRLATAGLVGLSVAACFRPMYGPTASGVPLKDVLAAIEVAPITGGTDQERVQHYLRNELVFELGGGAAAGVPKRYILEVSVTERVQAAIVDTQTGLANAATIFGDANFVLKPIGGGAPITSGRAQASASYDRLSQRYTTLRAARDTQVRVAKQLAEQIKTRIAAVLATRS